MNRRFDLRATRSINRAHPVAIVLIAAAMIASSETPVQATPEDLRIELARVLPSLAERGLSASVLFAPLDGPDRHGPGPGGDTTGVVAAFASESRIPASVTKLITTAAALDLLGPRYHFQTRIARTGPLEDGTLQGDLVVIGNGDPFLVSERLWMLASQLRLAGVHRVTGRLILDDSAWPPLSDLSSFAGSDRAYAALPSALSMNFNAIAFQVTPGRRTGDPVQVRLDPFDLPYLRIDNRLRTGGPGSSVDWRLDLTGGSTTADTTGILSTYPRETAVLAGTLPAGMQTFTAYRRAGDPLAFAGCLLAEFLREAGIEIEGAIVHGPAPPGAAQLLAFDSRPLDELIAGMNRYSNNFIANQLVVTLGRLQAEVDSLSDQAGTSDVDGPLRHGGAALSAWLQNRAGCTDSSYFADGSGLSTANRTTARTLVEVLSWAWHDLRTQGPFLASLGGPGQDGTLERRLPGVAGATLAGYLQCGDRTPVAFAILMQAHGDAWSVSTMQDLQDRWIEIYAR
ncbi:MAG: D-alanyl-D-alanine carboxypeptidase/D-alanyl-D-alanine-endopeptidase [Candidatus Eisenbacteria bacterium]|uniref:D-alanyl-D-alanine carboxypeptidase/D-alanyl-D-alanine-endopeptidase n=1 Tax=Eiseniibacteriota bacterium TaxID=2212470 RepID=A0A956LWH7_UNCEI|nr:D-alanyl-D-alanine carboxypeptidase/D-alanyl-D-alanine-endopeptidase [Candidatus Eisenbacteria bacterium]